MLSGLQTTVIGLAAVVPVCAAMISMIRCLVVRWWASNVVDHVAELALRDCSAERRAEIVAAAAKLAESLTADGRPILDPRRRCDE
jgi:hypothetical protein